MPFDRRTLAILRSAELGFLGVMVRTWVQTPRFCGAPFGCLTRRCEKLLKVYSKAGALLFCFLALRLLRINWLVVGTISLPQSCVRRTIALAHYHTTPAFWHSKRALLHDFRPFHFLEQEGHPYQNDEMTFPTTRVI